jgi:hypothetical protein
LATGGKEDDHRLCWDDPRTILPRCLPPCFTCRWDDEDDEDDAYFSYWKKTKKEEIFLFSGRCPTAWETAAAMASPSRQALMRYVD